MCNNMSVSDACMSFKVLSGFIVIFCFPNTTIFVFLDVRPTQCIDLRQFQTTYKDEYCIYCPLKNHSSWPRIKTND